MNFCNRISTTYFGTRATMARERRDRLLAALGLAGCIVSGVVICYGFWRYFKNI